MRKTSRLVQLAALTGAATLVVAACGGDDTGDGADTVSFLHAISGDQEQAALQEAIDAFEAETGNSVSAEFSPDFSTVIVTRVQGGNTPDVAIYPQPGLLQRIVDEGAVVSFADAGVETDNLIPGMVEAGTFDDETYGVVVKLSVKSLMWYPKAAFDAAGYAVPEAWADLESLTTTISATGTPAWCTGIEDGPATGWVATDWIEDIMLRLHGPDVYDSWTAGDLPFDSPEVRQAFEMLETLWFPDGNVLGGTTGILQTSFLASPAPMFDDPPACFLHKQMGFIEGEFPEDAELGADYDVAFLPPIDAATGNGALFAGDLAAVHSDNPAAAELVSFLASSAGQDAWLEHEGAGSLSVRTDFDSNLYPSDSLRAQGELLANADFARFDGSDLMPPAVGAGSFWREMVAWLGGQDLDTTLQNIDADWPN